MSFNHDHCDEPDNGSQIPATIYDPAPPAFHHNLHYPVDNNIPVQPGQLPPSLAALVNSPASSILPSPPFIPPTFTPSASVGTGLASALSPAPMTPVLPVNPTYATMTSTPVTVPAAAPPTALATPSAYPNNKYKNPEVAPGVYNVKVYVRCPDGQEKEIVIRTDICWLDFHRTTSEAQKLPTESNILEARYSRAKPFQFIVVKDSDGWTTLVNRIVESIPTARQNPVTLDIHSKSSREAAKSAKSTETTRRSSRQDDLGTVAAPGLSPGNQLSYNYFEQLKNQLRCMGCSRGNTVKYCFVDGKQHRSVSLEFIGKWALDCIHGRADIHTPPSCRLTDHLAPQQADMTSAFGNHLFSSPTPEPVHNPLRPSASRPLLPGEPDVPLSSPSLPDPDSVFDVLNEKSYESLLIPFPSVEDALESLHAAKPAHAFPAYLQVLDSQGYKYIDEVANASIEELTELGMFPPVARELHDFAKRVKRQVELQALK